MNRATEDSEQGFKDWLSKHGWVEDEDDYYYHEFTLISRTRVFLHGLFIDEANAPSFTTISKDAKHLLA